MGDPEEERPPCVCDDPPAQLTLLGLERTAALRLIDMGLAAGHH